jgi:hypothetical protein
MQSARILTEEIIDYAGLFPPAGLEMSRAVPNYGTYLTGPDAAMLGRFILPANRLSEFSRNASGKLPTHHAAREWRLSALLGDDFRRDIQEVLTFNSQHWAGAELGHAVVDTVEVKGTDVKRIKTISEYVPGFCRVFVEIPASELQPKLLDAVRSAGFGAKIRTGGVEQSSFPPSSAVIAFMEACRERSLAFKATAGLHHIVCGSYPLTYDVGAEKGEMFGFLNVFLAAAFLFHGLSSSEAEVILREKDANAFHFLPDSISWKDKSLSISQIASARAQFAVSYGSCSFTEPVQELKKLLSTQRVESA